MTLERRAERRARALATDTTPGKILVLGLLGNAPSAVAFVLAPILARGDPTASRPFIPWVLVLAPLLAVPAIWVFARATRERRAHQASRIGILLAGVAILLWFVLAALLLVKG